LTSLSKKRFPLNERELTFNQPIPAANLAKLQILLGYMSINFTRLITIAKSWIIKRVNQTRLDSKSSFFSTTKLKLRAVLHYAFVTIRNSSANILTAVTNIKQN
jgi:hypothetical protein